MSRASDAGVSWATRTTSAKFGPRFAHSSVIDARTRAIYVIGGQNGGTYFNDVLVSTDGGARPDYVGRGGLPGA